MARTASTTRRNVSADVTVVDFIYHVARNNGAMLTEAQIGNVLFQNEAQIVKAMRDAGLAYIMPTIDKLAGILPRQISDEQTNSAPLTDDQADSAVEALTGKKANSAKK